MIKHWWPTAVTAIVILYATLWPDPAGADKLPLVPHLDKIIHAIMFGGLAGAMAFDYSRLRNIPKPSVSRMALFAAISATAGGIIELLQQAMHLGRGCDIYDFASDCLGAAVAWYLAPVTINAIRNHKQSVGT